MGGISAEASVLPRSAKSPPHTIEVDERLLTDVAWVKATAVVSGSGISHKFPKRLVQFGGSFQDVAA
jgi:hypothetical protein